MAGTRLGIPASKPRYWGLHTPPFPTSEGQHGSKRGLFIQKLNEGVVEVGVGDWRELSPERRPTDKE